MRDFLKQNHVTGLAYDSRRVKPGDLYFALRGLHADGHAFIRQAVAAGAAAVVCEEPALERGAADLGVPVLLVPDARFAMSAIADAFYEHPSRELTVVGVTGTEGKSTTVYLIYQLLTLLGRKAGFISTVKLDDGTGEYWNSEHQTTPEAVTVHRLLAEMLKNGAEFAVVEASSHGLSRRTNRLGDVSFDAGVMTNVTHEHLEFHGTWEQYRYDKAELFRALGRGPKARPAGAAAVPPFGVVNADDPSAAYFVEAAACPVLTHSVRGAPADLTVQSLVSEAGGNRCEVRAPGGAAAVIEDRLPGAFNAGNVLASLLVVSRLLSLDPLRDVAPLVPRLRPVRGRMTAIDKGQPFEVLVDYAHTPSSFETIFPPLRRRMDASGGRIIALFGSAGERDTAKRPAQGRIAAAYADIVILTDEDPRFEDGDKILEEIAEGCAGKTPGEDLFLIADRPAAIRKAFALARPGDLVLLLGKGHENSIIYADRVMPYDEIREAEAALAELA